LPWGYGIPGYRVTGAELPSDFQGFLWSLYVRVVCVSYAICVGVFAQTQEQANGFGAVSIVILSAVGGLMVPSFAMPDSFRTVVAAFTFTLVSGSLLWLVPRGGKLKDVLTNIIPLFVIIILIHLLILLGLKRKKLI